MVNKTIKQRLRDMFLNQLLKQIDSGTPIEALGFMTHPNSEGMPTIKHEDTPKRPQWVEDELDGWEQLQ